MVIHSRISQTIEFIRQSPIVSGAVLGGSILAGGLVVRQAVKRRKAKKKAVTRKKRSKTSSVRRVKRKLSKHAHVHRGTKAIHKTKKGQPYIILPNGRARFISKASAKARRKRKGGYY